MGFSLARVLSGGALVSLVFLANVARADDTADEADLHFRIGADRYAAGDYRGALEHFLASNRLAPNRNVVFNIARVYEKLERYPEAYRYYDSALAAETDAAAKTRISQALQQIRPHVAVLEIKSTPPGATIFVDRKDLGPRGESPRALGLAAGSYKVIAELPGYYPAEVTVDKVAVGAVRPVDIVLQPILGTLRVEGNEVGAGVAVDDPRSAPRCSIPCKLELSPGRHILYLTRMGYRSSELAVEVAPRTEIAVQPSLQQLSGTAVVTTDEPGAVVEVDGQTRGFTPAILTLPAGEHQLRISFRGFRTIERTVSVLPDRQVRVDETLTQSEEVQAASRITESVEDAPSSVTIIPREEIVAFGYPTIVDSVRGVRGMYTWNDRSYASLGVRGLGGLGSYTNRELVLQDGHPTNDNWVGSAYVGFDGRADLGDVERIEVVRGPGSVLYGANAFSGVINVVTRQGDQQPRFELGVSAVDAGVARARVRAQAKLGKDSGVWTSVSGAHGAGRDFYFPELADPRVPDSGVSRNSDGFNAGTLQGRVWWKFVTLQWFYNSHDKALPTGEYLTRLGDPRTHQRDSRGFVEARVEPTLSNQVRLLFRTYVNSYRFSGDYSHTLANYGLERDRFVGYWVGAEPRVVFTPLQNLRVTVGGEYQRHFKADQTARDTAGPYLDDSRQLTVGALYGNADIAISDAIRVSGGVRWDNYSMSGKTALGDPADPTTAEVNAPRQYGSVNPRLAVIVKPYERGITKLMVGKAFRTPSAYERYYNDGGFTQVASPALKPESIYSVEIEHSHRFSPTVIGLGTVFANYVDDLIVQRGAGDDVDPTHYVNSQTPILSTGAELAVRREWRRGWMVQGSYGYQYSQYLASPSAGDLFGLKKDPNSREVANSPNHLASVKAAAPILARGLTAATRITVEGLRYDRYEQATDPTQGHTNAAVIWDLVLTGREDRWGIGYSFGCYNVTDWRYSLPLSGEFVQRSLVQNGRTFLASADVRF